MKFSVNYTADLTKIEIRIIFEPLTIAIFRLCLLPKMRLSVDLEGRCTAYQSPIYEKNFPWKMLFGLKNIGQLKIFFTIQKYIIEPII